MDTMHGFETLLRVQTAIGESKINSLHNYVIALACTLLFRIQNKKNWMCHFSKFEWQI